ncbi:ABC transporter permease [Nocardioides halotolerans]|uniref:ABC transporter permease n=1 Tax=Nocardioides halotolerans TaxID=433660 RepID=UPI000401B69D|nr:ABC transporter permease [Nocardioides halotolerans]
MSSIILNSIISGALYTITALGLVAVYKTTRVFNFAHGLISGFCGYFAYQVIVRWEQSFVIGVIAAVLIGAAIGWSMERLLLSRMYQRSALELVIATFGVSLVLQFAIVKIWGTEERTIPPPFEGDTVSILGGTVPTYGVAVVVVSAAVVAALSLVLLRTKLGLQARVTFEDPVAARLVGVNVVAVRSLSWALGGALAGLAGSLLAPLIFLSPTSMNIILITAFAAAVIGGFSSFSGAAVGGLIVASTLNFGASYVSLQFRNLILYAVILGFLWLRPYGLLGEEEDHEVGSGEGERQGRLAAAWAALQRRGGRGVDLVRARALRGHAPQWVLIAAGFVVVLLAPQLAGVAWQLSLTQWMVTFVAVAGLSLIMCYAHQFSLAQNAFMGFGAYLTAWVVADDPGRWPLALVVVLLGSAALAFVMAIPSARLRGAYFAAMTLALGLALPEAAYNWTSLTEGANGKLVSTPTWGEEFLTFDQMYYMCAVVALIVLVALVLFRNSRWGRRMVLVSDAPRAAATVGLSPYWWQVGIITAGCALGGLAGSLSALQAGIATPTSFTLELALLLFVGTVVSGSTIGSLWGSALIVLVPVFFKTQAELSTALFGVAMIAALFLLPKDMSTLDVLRRRRTPPSMRTAEPPRSEVPAPA